jgi:tetratricopeptide (TPR) repeat protein
MRWRRPREACSRSTASRVPLATCLALTALLLAACASYVARSGEIREALVSADYGRALSAVEDINQSNSKLLYLYEKGLVLHCQGVFDSSSAAFSQSELVLEDLYTRSITREAASLAISETIAQYRGDAFEAVYVNYYQILNYLGRGDIDGAVVECRRVNRKLQMLNDGGETYFTNDPFMQYLTGLVYEMGGERDEAGVSFRVAAELYDGGEFAAVAPLPPSFYCDASANARARGDREDAESYSSRAGCAVGADTGRVSILLDCGEIVRKREASVVLPIFESDRWTDNERFAHELETRNGVHYGHEVHVKYWLKVALPALEVLPPRYTGVVVRAIPQGGDEAGQRITSAHEVRAVVASNLDALAEQAFREKESTMFARAIVRALVKYLAHESADKKDEGLGALVNILGMVTETADTRSWSTLPSQVYLARLDLPAGRYRIEAELLGPGGRVGSITFDDVAVAAGRHVIRNARAF